MTGMTEMTGMTKMTGMTRMTRMTGTTRMIKNKTQTALINNVSFRIFITCCFACYSTHIFKSDLK